MGKRYHRKLRTLKVIFLLVEILNWRGLEISPVGDYETHKLELPRFRSTSCNSCLTRPDQF